MLRHLRRCLVVGAVLLFPIALTACSSSGQAVPPTTTSSDDAANFARQGGFDTWVAYLPQGPFGLQCNPIATSGIEIVTASGHVLRTLSIDSLSLGLDDAGNLYNLYSVPSAEGCGIFRTDAVLQRYAPGSTKPNATYQPVSNADWVGTSGAGEVAAVSATLTPTGDTANVGMWPPGAKGGPPSYSLAVPQTCYAFDLHHDGTLYISQYVNGASSYAVFPPGSTMPRTIPETIVPPSQQANFCANYMTVGRDGTLYVTEYSFFQPDPLAGLYIYSPDGRERFVATTSDSNGPGPEGVDLDAAGNIYVANNNNAVTINSSGNLVYQSDSLHDVEVFAPRGRSVLRHITGDFDPIALAVTPDGTVFFSSYSFAPSTGVSVVYGTFAAAPGSTKAIQVAENGQEQIVLYNGRQEAAASTERFTASYSGGAAAAHAGAASLTSYLRTIHRIP
jgi:hypothetical protein